MFWNNVLPFGKQILKNRMRTLFWTFQIWCENVIEITNEVVSLWVWMSLHNLGIDVFRVSRGLSGKRAPHWEIALYQQLSWPARLPESIWRWVTVIYSVQQCPPSTLRYPTLNIGLAGTPSSVLLLPRFEGGICNSWSPVCGNPIQAIFLPSTKSFAEASWKWSWGGSLETAVQQSSLS